jgi:regulatory protein
MRLRQRGFDDASIERVLLKLKEQGLIDDIAFARFWMRNRESFSPRSWRMLQHELRQKGISPHIIAEVAEGVDDQGSAYRAAQKKASKSTSSDYYSFRRKFSVFLRRRGFDYDIIQQTVNQLWQELGEGKNA